MLKEFGEVSVKELMPQGLSSFSDTIAKANLDRGAVSVAVPQGQEQRPDPAIETICGELMLLQRRRVFCIRTQSKLDRSVEAYIRVRLGFNTALPEKERKVISAQARRIKETVERGGDLKSLASNGLLRDIAADCSAVILPNLVGRKTWDELREKTEADMIRLAKQLPAYAFIESVKGVSAKALAVIVGEAGNLSNYPDRSRLQKRLGMACIDGVKQGNPGQGATAEDWIRHGYNKARRAEIWALLDDVMFRAQWRGDKTADGGEPAHSIGPYGAYYGRKKAEYLIRGWTAGHADRAARRYMAKMFVRDLWVAWRAANLMMPLGQHEIAVLHVT